MRRVSGSPIGAPEMIIGEGGTVTEAVADVLSAIQFHEETFGPVAWLDDDPVPAIDVHDARRRAEPPVRW